MLCILRVPRSTEAFGRLVFKNSHILSVCQGLHLSKTGGLLILSCGALGAKVRHSSVRCSVVTRAVLCRTSGFKSPVELAQMSVVSGISGSSPTLTPLAERPYPFLSTGGFRRSRSLQWAAPGHCVLGYWMCTGRLSWGLHSGLQLRLLDREYYLCQLRHSRSM